jgi:outer membrane immunogenic protein
MAIVRPSKLQQGARQMKEYIAAAATLFISTATSAANFTGPWIEARGGFDSVELKVSAKGASVADSKGGFGYGAATGFDFALGSKAIAGVQLGAYGTSTKACSAIYGNDQACLKAGRDLEVLARLGFKAGNDTLIYGLVGYANGKISANYIDFGNSANNGSASATGGGVRVGAGFEQAFGKIFAKAEYRYTSYSKSDIGFGANAGFNRNQVLVGVGYRF